MQFQQPGLVKQQRSALKRNGSADTSSTTKRYDRKGQEISGGNKYEVTISEHIEYLTPISICRTNNTFPKPPLRSQNIDHSQRTSITPVIQQLPIIVKNQELTQEEQEQLKKLDENLQKIKKNRQQEQCCCIIQ